LLGLKAHLATTLRQSNRWLSAADAIGDEPDQVRMLYCLDCDPPDIREMEEVWRRPVDAEEIKERVLDFEEDYEDDYED
jgi:hypothetical protein